MKILHLSTSDINGGASRAAFRLHTGLLLKGVGSFMFVRDKKSNSESIIRYKYPKGLKKIGYKYRLTGVENDFNKYRYIRSEGLETFSDDRTPLRSGLIEQIPDADIYNLHWVSGFIDLPEFFHKIKKPVVWTLHDMFPFTGGCHYNSGCEHFKTYCHNCPQLGSTKEKDLSYQIWKRKLKSITELKSKMVIRADSLWLAGEAKKSSLFSDMDIETIHYGIETDEFVPLDKMACRTALNIPLNSRVIVFGAPGVDNPRKGLRQLIAAVNLLSRTCPDIFLLSFGSGDLPRKMDFPGLHIGHVASNRLLSIIYNCADVFVIPSLEEAFGQTALEAMSCGVPVVGFNTGGIPDIIENGLTGYLAENGNIEALATEITRVLSLDEMSNEKMAKNCRKKVLGGFTIAHQAERYIKLYSRLF